MKKVLFFDMYQTLVDTYIGDKKSMVTEAYISVYGSFLIAQGIEKEEAEKIEEKCALAQSIFYNTHDKEKEHHDIRKIIKAVFLESYGIDVEEKTLSDLIYMYRKKTRGNTYVYDGVKEVLEILSKEYTLYIASYTQAAYSLPELEEFDIKGYFTDFIFSSDIGYRKTSDYFWKKCIEISGVEAHECVMIGDNRYEDMYMAHKHGMKTIWIENNVYVDMYRDMVVEIDERLSHGEFALLPDVVKRV